MSFVRAGRPQQHSKGKACPKKTAAPRREWVSTVSDLSVHKLSPAELSHRHEIHKSSNKAAAQWELKEKALKRRFTHAGSPAILDKASLSIIREVFSDQLLLQDVLARSDRALAVVKDLFGDAPRRQTGHPSVTVAPNCYSDSDLPVLQRPDPPTHLSLLSQSMMDQEALNEREASEEDAHLSDSSEHHVIRRANVQKMKAQSLGRVIQQKKVHSPNHHHRNRDNTPVTPCTSGRAPDQAALNATVAVQRVRSKQSQSAEEKEETSVLVSQVLNPELPLSNSGRISSRTSRTRKCVSQSSELDGSSVGSLGGDQSSLGLLQSMLGRVEADLDSLSPDGAPAPAQSPNQHRTQGLTGFSVALVSTLGRLVHLIKQRTEEAHGEAEERRRLEEALKEQWGLIDALTAETMTLREEAAALRAGFQQRTAELEQKLDSVVLVMGGLGLLGERMSVPQDSDVGAAGCQSAPVAERVPEQTQVCVSPAVLLSPPRQGDNCLQIPVTHPLPVHQSPVDILRSWEDLQSNSSASSLNRLPSASSLSLSSDPLRSQLCPKVMLADIAQLSRENELIRAQLSQAQGLRSGDGGALNSSSERRWSSPSSTGRVTPESTGERRMCGSSSTGRVTPESSGERRMCGSSSTGRRSQHNQASGEEQATQQAASPNTSSANSVEQRLLELNRQRAAARVRLLELIEQQKQSVSPRASPSVSPSASPSVSPSVSPIPPSAFSPNAAAGEGSSEVSLVLPELELQSYGDGGVERRFGGETSVGETQVEQQREREGWFALSAHVR
ncbi:spindle and centriole-associated protein 1 isoform X2 [Brachyistius frenatus]|uniref:spindle and centriole-associated protein 1 isoform X2 n=1 Tax=Brachyistius frenatus TaxID=100188 RepID=UPI0037E8220A